VAARSRTGTRAQPLVDRGFGRPQQTTLVGAADEQASYSPYEHLSDEELNAKLRLLETLTAPAA
jgi:hypothetical protein